MCVPIGLNNQIQPRGSRAKSPYGLNTSPCTYNYEEKKDFAMQLGLA